jgi:hypothetical protein
MHTLETKPAELEPKLQVEQAPVEGVTNTSSWARQASIHSTYYSLTFTLNQWLQ